MKWPLLYMILLVIMPFRLAGGNETGVDEIRTLAADPSSQDWAGLSCFDETITRKTFETRLNSLWDPEGGMCPYLVITDARVDVYLDQDHAKRVVSVRFAHDSAKVLRNPSSFRTPERFRGSGVASSMPLAGLKIAIDPADIGGNWAKMEDRSVLFKGYGMINEGDLNVVVGRLLKTRLEALGAKVLLVRNSCKPMLNTTPEAVEAEVRRMLRDDPRNIPSSMMSLAAAIRSGKKWKIRWAASQLYTKTLETRAREQMIRRTFTPDFTLILQHNATTESAKGKLTKLDNRNIFFVSGMYRKSGLKSAAWRYHLLRKLLENVTPVESAVSGSVSSAFRNRTGYPAVMYGNSVDTRLVIPGNDYVVARNLMFTREHDGPTIVVEPYFMNNHETLLRLLAGDYAGERKIDGKMQKSLFREYADCVVTGILATYARK